MFTREVGAHDIRGQEFGKVLLVLHISLPPSTTHFGFGSEEVLRRHGKMYRQPRPLLPSYQNGPDSCWLGRYEYYIGCDKERKGLASYFWVPQRKRYERLT